jgi:hypothetical protein
MRKFLFAASVLAAIGILSAVPSVQAQPYGYGMMGQGYGSGYGPGMMGGYGPGMMGGYGPGYMMAPGYGHGWMMGPGMMGYGSGYGPGWGMHRGWGPGFGSQGNLNLSTDDVKNYLERTMRNPNLKIGEVKEKDDDTIVADILTKDKDGLVQRLEINRKTGYFQPEQ